MRSHIKLQSSKMDRWNNRVAVVSGASAGIGAVLVKDLVKAGLKVVGLARREERVEQLRNELPKHLQSKLFPLQCDVTNEEQVKKAFAWIDENLDGTDVLVNCAGVMKFMPLTHSMSGQAVRDTIDTNIMGVYYCTREAYQSMRKRNFAGHVINLNSVVGHQVPVVSPVTPSVNIYAASKFAVKAMTETYRHEFRNDKSNVKITSISPGPVDTDLFPDEAKRSMKVRTPMLKGEDISGAILYALATPPSVQVTELTISPLGDTTLVAM